MTDKVCTCCKKKQPINKFTISKLSKDGFSGRCRTCDKRYLNRKALRQEAADRMLKIAPSKDGIPWPATTKRL